MKNNLNPSPLILTPNSQTPSLHLQNQNSGSFPGKCGTFLGGSHNHDYSILGSIFDPSVCRTPQIATLLGKSRPGPTNQGFQRLGQAQGRWSFWGFGQRLWRLTTMEMVEVQGLGFRGLGFRSLGFRGLGV